MHNALIEEVDTYLDIRDIAAETTEDGGSVTVTVDDEHDPTAVVGAFQRGGFEVSEVEQGEDTFTFDVWGANLSVSYVDTYDED